MTVLKREGMGPLSPEFAEACRRVNDDAPSKRNYHPLPPSTTPEEFREALRVVGIEDAKKLAEALGLNMDDPSAARRIIADPTNHYTSKHAEKLRPMVERMRTDAFRAASEAMKEAEREAKNARDEYEALLIEYEVPHNELNRASEVAKAEGLLLGDAATDEWFEALQLEFALRALVEGALALDADGIETLLRNLWGLLETNPLTDDAPVIAGALERHFNGMKVVLNEQVANLSALIVGGEHERDASGDFIEHDLSQAAIDEYCGFSTETN